MFGQENEYLQEMKKCLTASLFKYPLAVVAGSMLMEKYETVMRWPPYNLSERQGSNLGRACVVESAAVI